MIVKLRYSDGSTVLKTFKTQEELDWFIHNEGDHLVEVTLNADSCGNS
jgi:hypothetical protein